MRISISEFLSIVVKESKSNQWHNATYDINGSIVGIKQFGKWVQVISANGIRDGIPEQKTQKELKEKVLNMLSAMKVEKDSI